MRIKPRNTVKNREKRIKQNFDLFTLPESNRDEIKRVLNAEIKVSSDSKTQSEQVIQLKLF
jgi:hypothetical protein